MIGTLYACSEIILGFLRRSGSTDPSRDRQSLRIIWLTIGISVVASIYAADKFRSAGFRNHEIFTAGVVLFFMGIALRWYSIIRLGRFFTVDVTIATAHRVIDTGPYHLVRHPSYTGALIAFVGYGLCLGNWISFAVLLLPITAAFFWRMHVEEQALTEALGDDYRRYAARTKRLIPFLY
jgi:protein-S-isoprenylcysteine O-methyltransferase